MFDESFLKSRIKKQQGWKKRGIRSGSGKPFAESLTVFGGNQCSLTESPAFLRQKNKGGGVGVGVGVGDGLGGGDADFDFTVSSLIPVVFDPAVPNWLQSLISSDPKLKAAFLAKKSGGLSSPHGAALVALAKNPKRLSRNAEHFIQVRLFYTVETQYPQFYPMMKAVPNGGLRAATTAAALKAEGQKAGEPDIELMIPRGRYFGLFLEVKTESGTLQDNQKEALARYNGLGYCAVWGKGFDQCLDHLIKYFELPDFDNKTEL